ncbi:MAG: hypothetical protein RIR01_239, partial [Bacteroidota bacterium]
HKHLITNEIKLKISLNLVIFLKKLYFYIFEGFRLHKKSQTSNDFI